MQKGRLEAYTDAVLAILMTILILGIKIPDEPTFEALFEIKEQLFAYILSFLLFTVYWNNHHHMFQLAEKINGKVMWANSFWLFFLSLIPAATSWVGTFMGGFAPEITYGVLFMLVSISYFFLNHILASAGGVDSAVYKAIEHDWKVPVTLVINGISLGLAFINPVLTFVGCYVVIIIWFIPNRRVEKFF